MIDYVSITPKYKNDSHFHGKKQSLTETLSSKNASWHACKDMKGRTHENIDYKRDCINHG
ncbi:hypothetical protein MTBBW1_410006 [Desulfamplus magnetovallimortis]|uniref:Uncharacterized protein n=1 Tax=Desulfamplus magnetovallimortis TaxID=1246637 RepID=A0A1W1HGL2_9BACT|nr:hypothetical protein MTBBW1_410006 [Desulfamplus magnetovallimortis]